MSKIKAYIKNFIEKVNYFFDIPSLDMSSERKEELIEKIARSVVKYGMELPASLYIPGFIPAAPFISQLVILPAAPFLELLGINGYEYVAFFYDRDNVKRLMDRIEELQKNK
jgi:hypothetical protein